ncbi:alpha/beta hydrolase [Salinisphaera orenii MK-B5]|uniref:Alpha/beta hydrolase n=1 Tax=Salinisphaera orenii MK-B5 TaxID=856730 RepID=A0A423PLQ1_9GAMM|nr:alpha/beta hydrolase [Salinisphaera orenii]ROO26499.1 alpha/beta hydrolase [Salinisphaera orenii MK-B5]
MPLQHVEAGDLVVAYEAFGPPGAPAAVLLHGFPYDVAAVRAAAERLAARGLHVVAPYLRGFGPTRFIDVATRRSGQQAALGHDLRAFIDALALVRPVVAGFDWGGRAACIVAALWPERVAGLVSCGGYNIQDIPSAQTPLSPAMEARLWYQFYFHGERGRAGLTANRRELAWLLWRQWSPTWPVSRETFAASAPAFDNPDFVDVVIHSYRHRYARVAGDPRFEATEARLAAQPAIAVPSIVLEGADSGLFAAAGTSALRRRFPRLVAHRVLAEVGHNPPQEAPETFADAVVEVACRRG